MVTIINYLSNKGLTPNQIAGVMGSIALGNEDYKTDVDVEDSNKKKNAGLCQWKDDRRTKLMESAEKENKNWTDLVFQLDFAWSELTTNPSYKKNVLDWFKSHPNAGIKEYVGSTVDGDGNEIKIYRRIGVETSSIKQIMSKENLTEKEAYYKYGAIIFEAKDAQYSIRTRIIKAKNDLDISDDIISLNRSKSSA